MKFYGREEELKALDRIETESRAASRFTVVTGRRRIGKTALVLKSVENKPHIYLFITRTNEPVLCENMQKILTESGVEVNGRLTRVADVLKTLMLKSAETPMTLILDEFQDLRYVDESIFSQIQEVWDRYRDTSKLNLIVSGSVHSMMTRIFEDEKEPLFGRPTGKMVLRPLPVSLMQDILADHNPGYGKRDLLTLFYLTGGVPLYIQLLMERGAFDHDRMLDAVLSPGSVFISDGKDILVTEFGRDYRTYFSIMQLISSGKGRRSEIEDVLRMETGPYLDRLKNEYGFVDNIVPILTKAETKNTRWVVSDMYLRFYFRFLYPCWSYVESGRFDLLRRSMEQSLETYEGHVLEDFFRRRISEQDTYTSVGGYWNRKGDVEIDIVVVDDIDRRCRFIEVKRNREKLDMPLLRKKSEPLLKSLDGYDIVYDGLSMDDI